MKNKKIFNIALSLFLVAIIAICIIGNNNKASAGEVVSNDTVVDLFSTYYNKGTYRKNTIINVDTDKIAADKNVEKVGAFFHAGHVPALVRTTDYTPGRLVMTTESNSTGSGYKNSGSNMVRFSIVDGVEKDSFTVENTSVEKYYVTLKDFVDQSVTNEYSEIATDISDATWMYENGIYSTTDAEVIDAFRLFTAPMWIGKTASNANYIDYTKATVEVVENDLVMKLWVSSSEKEGKLVSDAEVVGTDAVFSQAAIKTQILRGSTVSMPGADAIDNPVMTNNDTGLSGVSFNVNASKYYYVEMTMSKVAFVNNQIIAMSHNLAANGIPTEGLYYTGFKFNANGYEYAHSKYVNGWNFHAQRMWMGAAYGNSRVEGINADLANGNTKLAVARAGDYFYYFINDKLYVYAIYPELVNKDTYPGLIFEGSGQKVNADFRNFVFVRGQEKIEAKINSLIGASTFEKYGRWDSSLTAANTSYNDPNGFTFLSAEQTGTGAGSDTNNAINANMTTPYVHLYGNWEVSYDVTLNVLGDGGGWGALWTDIRTVHDNFSVFSWRDRGNRANYFAETEISASEVGSISVKSSTLGLLSRDAHPTYHVTIRCEVKSGSVETYTITVTAGDVTMTQVFDITYNNSSRSYSHGSPKYFIFKSQKWAGTVSNFTAKNI